MSLFLLLLPPWAGCALAALLPTHARHLESSWAAAAAAVAALLALLYPALLYPALRARRQGWAFTGVGLEVG